MKRWTALATVVAIVMFGVACSDEIYRLTSPPSLDWHILLRKSYSVVAFALVGYLLRRALVEHARRNVVSTCIGAIALYSGLIEVAQFALGAREGLAWNAFDVLCGALGGAIAVGDRLFFSAQRNSR